MCICNNPTERKRLTQTVHKRTLSPHAHSRLSAARPLRCSRADAAACSPPAATAAELCHRRLRHTGCITRALHLATPPRRHRCRRRLRRPVVLAAAAAIAAGPQPSPRSQPPRPPSQPPRRRRCIVRCGRQHAVRLAIPAEGAVSLVRRSVAALRQLRRRAGPAAARPPASAPAMPPLPLPPVRRRGRSCHQRTSSQSAR